MKFWSRLCLSTIALQQYLGATALNTTTTTTMTPGIEPLSKGVEDLIQKSATLNSNSKSLSQAHWDNVSQWIKSVLGEECDVAHHEIIINNPTVETVWYLSGIVHGEEGDNLVLDVKTSTSVGSDGNLDVAKSSSMALDNLRFELKNTQMDLGPDDEVLSTIWEPAPLADYAQYALQYKSGIPRGQMLIVSGNCMINLYGGSSSASLEPIVKKILSYTTVNSPSSVHIPNVTEYRFDVPGVTRGHESNVVKGIGSPFSVHCNLPQSIAAATAHVLDSGLLLKDYTINNTAAEGMSTVTFTFVTWKIGTHDIDLSFASAPELTTSKKRIQVKVIKA